MVVRMTSEAPGGFNTRQTLAAVGIAAIIAAFGGAAIYATTDAGPHSMGGWGGPGPASARFLSR
jgi:hypothetical protein